MELMGAFLSEQITERIGWVLIHFLWQGIAVAALMWCVLKALSKASANTRYIAACAGLVLMVAAPITTFMITAPDEPITISAPTIPPALPTMDTVPAATRTIVVDAIEVEPLPKATLMETLIAKLEAVLPYCVISWAIGVAILSVWYLGGWCQLQKLRRIGTKTVSETVAQKTSELANRLGVKRIVHITESALVQVPTVIGWLKPVILLPATALTGLDEVQLTAMIAHELAHIKRCDYLINIIQTVVEILGFYHPAIWWMSRQIRTERENCCDDMAVALVQNRREYAGALFTMEAIRSKQLDLAVAANGGHLTNRISRLAGKQQKSQKSGWVVSIIAIIAIMTTCVLAMGNRQKIEKLPELFQSLSMPYSIWMADINGDDMKVLDLVSGNVITLEDLKTEHDFIQKIVSISEGDIVVNYKEDLKKPMVTFLRHAGLGGEPASNEYLFVSPIPIELPWETVVTTQLDYKFQFRIVSANEQACNIEYWPINQKAKEAMSNKAKVEPADTDSNDPSTTETWEKAFYDVYRLDDGQILKRIAPPFIPERKDFYYDFHYCGQDFSQSEQVPEPPDFFAFDWDNELKTHRAGSMGGYENINLIDVLEYCLNIPVTQFEGPPEVFKLPIPGDWIVRKSATDTEKLQALETILKQELGKQIRFQKREVTRPVIVAKGTYKFIPPHGTYNDKHVHFYSDKLDTKEGVGGGTAHTVAELMAVLGERTGIQAIDETKNSSQKINQRYSFNRSSRLRNVANRDEKNDKIGLMMENLKKQTNLEFTIEERLVSKWFVVDHTDGKPSESSPQSSDTEDSPPATMGGGMGAVQTVNTEQEVSTPQILTTAYLVSVPADMPELNGLIPDGKSNSEMISPEKLKKILGAIQSNPQAKIIANPRILIIDGEVATFEALAEAPLTGKEGKVKYKEIGVKLTVTPHLSSDGKTVRTDVAFTSTRFEQDLISDTYTLSPTLLSGHAFALGGHQTEPGMKEILLIQPTILDNQTPTAQDWPPAAMGGGMGGMPNMPEKTAETQSELKILDVEFDPIDQGKNILWITVENTADKPKFFSVNIYTRSVDYGPQGVGWGTNFYEKFSPGETKKLRYAYKIQGPVTENTYVRLSFYNPVSLNHDENKDLKHFSRKVYKSGDLTKRKPSKELKPVTEDQFEIVSKALKTMQSYIQNKEYDKAWDLFTEDHKQAEYQTRGIESFKRQMEPEHPLHSAFTWEKSDFLKLIPQRAFENNGTIQLHAACDDANWTIDFVEEHGKWKISWIAGYRPKVLDMQEADSKKEEQTQEQKQIAIEARFLLITDGFLEDIGLDADLRNDYETSGGIGEIVVGPANSEEVVAALKHKPLDERKLPPLVLLNGKNTNKSGLKLSEQREIVVQKLQNQRIQSLDDLQTEFILRATQAHRNAKQLQAPKVMVLNGESATMQIMTDVRYKTDKLDKNTYWHESDTDSNTNDVQKGITIDIQPTLQNDDKEVLIKGHMLYSDILEWQDHGEGDNEYSIPIMQVGNIPIHALVKSGGTILVEGPEMRSYKETVTNPGLRKIPVLGRHLSNVSIVDERQRILVLIKPTFLKQKEVEPDAVGTLAPQPNPGGMMGGN